MAKAQREEYVAAKLTPLLEPLVAEVLREMPGDPKVFMQAWLEKNASGGLAAPAAAAETEERTLAKQTTRQSMVSAMEVTSIEEQIKAFDLSTVTFPIKATCELAPKGKPCGGGSEEAPGCMGMVKLTQLDADTIEIEWEITGGGKEGLHGFHIHETSDFSNGCASAGPHYNPFNKWHGAPEDDERHAGGLGNIKVDAEGKSSGSMKDRLVKIFGPTTCVGRSVMVHADEDDLGLGDNSKAHEPGPPQNGFVSKITGNAGARIACGEIVLA